MLVYKLLKYNAYLFHFISLSVVNY